MQAVSGASENFLIRSQTNYQNKVEFYFKVKKIWKGKSFDPPKSLHMQVIHWKILQIRLAIILKIQLQYVESLLLISQTLFNLRQFSKLNFC